VWLKIRVWKKKKTSVAKRGKNELKERETETERRRRGVLQEVILRSKINKICWWVSRETGYARGIRPEDGGAMCPGRGEKWKVRGDEGWRKRKGVRR